MNAPGKLYPEVLLEHHRAPRHAVRLPSPTHAADGNNPLCGDRVAVTLVLGDGRVLAIGCEVRGCAICRAAGSMMAEAVTGRELRQVNDLLRRFLDAIAEPLLPENAADSAAAAEVDSDSDPTPDWGPLAALLDARRFPNRRRCASLSWEVLERALVSPGAG